MNASCVHLMVSSDCQVSAKIINSDQQVQLTVVCTNLKCLLSSVGLHSIVLLCQTLAKAGKAMYVLDGSKGPLANSDPSCTWW